MHRQGVRTNNQEPRAFLKQRTEDVKEILVQEPAFPCLWASRRRRTGAWPRS
jgi:hypothetical protein